MKHSPNTGEKCKCRNTKSPIATIRFWNANCPIHTESEVKKTKPSQQELWSPKHKLACCKECKCGCWNCPHTHNGDHTCYEFQPPKSSEWEDEIDSCISSIVGSQSEVEIMDAANHIKDKVKDLLSQQQKRFEEMIGEDENVKKDGKKWLVADFEIPIRNQFRAELRKKLK